jgi:phosphocarrier protein HPr
VLSQTGDLNVLASLFGGSNGVAHSGIHDGLPSETIRPPALAARREVEVVNKLGMHLRASAKFVTLAREFQATVAVIHHGRHVSGNSILDLTSLAVECGSRIILNADGPDAEAVVDALTSLIIRHFDEE